MRQVRRDEDGASLIFALLFLTVVALVAAGLATLGEANLKTSTVVESKRDQQFAADGGIDYALKRLTNDDTGTATPSLCPAVGTPWTTSVPLNDFDVTVTCEALEGGSNAGAFSHSLIVTGFTQQGSTPPAASLITLTDAGNKNRDISVGGPAFNAGGFLLSAGNAFKLTFENTLDEHDPYCTTARAAAAGLGNPVVIDPDTNWRCISPGPVPDPDPQVTSVPPLRRDPVLESPQCEIFFPGLYTSKPTFSKKSSYLASGVYYLDNVGEVSLQEEIFGGASGGEPTQMKNKSPCASDDEADEYAGHRVSGTGVLFVLKGDSTLKVPSDNRHMVELFTRRPTAATAASEPPAGYTVIAPKPESPHAWTMKSAITMDSNKPTLVVHGAVYLPHSEMKAWGLPNRLDVDGFQFGGGLVVSSLFLAVNSDSDGFKFAGIPGNPERRVLVTATALRPGGSSVVSKAVVNLDGSGGADVESWRFE